MDRHPSGIPKRPGKVSGISPGWRTGLLAAAAATLFFFLLGGVRFRQSLNVSYHDLHKPSANGACWQGAVAFRASGPVFWWTRASVRTREMFVFSRFQAGYGWVPFATFAFRESDFGEKDFFRKPVLIPGGRPWSRTWIRMQLRADSKSPEFRVATLDYQRPLAFFAWPDSLLLLTRACLAGLLAWAVLFITVFPDKRKLLRLEGLSRNQVMLGLVFITLALRLLIAYRVFGATSDMLFWIFSAEARHQSFDVYSPLYVLGSGFTYDKHPLLLGMGVLARQLSDRLGYPFPFTFRLGMIAADLGLTLLVAEAAFRRTRNLRLAFLLGLGYSLNPVILAVFVHGQVDALVLLGIVAAWACLRWRPGSWGGALAAGALLGLGAGIKYFALVPIPWFLAEIKSPGKRLAFLAACVFAFLLPIGLYPNSGQALKQTLTYTGGGYEGWGITLFAGVFRAANLVLVKLGHAPWFHPEWFSPLENWKWGPTNAAMLMLAAATGILFFTRLRRLGPLHAWLLLCLTLFTFGHNIAPQYWSWPIAAGLIVAIDWPEHRTWLAVFTVSAGLIYGLSLLVDRNLLAPLLGWHWNIPWSAGWLATLGLRLPLWLFCCVWWWQTAVRQQPAPSLSFKDEAGVRGRKPPVLSRKGSKRA